MLSPKQTKTIFDEYVFMIKTITIYFIDNKNKGNIILKQADHQSTMEADKISQLRSSLLTHSEY